MPCLIPLSRTSSTILSKSGESEHPCLVPDLRGRKNQQGNIGIEPYFRPSRLNRHIYNIPSNTSRIHILLKCTQSVFQDRSYDRT